MAAKTGKAAAKKFMEKQAKTPPKPDKTYGAIDFGSRANEAPTMTRPTGTPESENVIATPESSAKAALEGRAIRQKIINQQLAEAEAAAATLPNISNQYNPAQMPAQPQTTQPQPQKPVVSGEYEAETPLNKFGEPLPQGIPNKIIAGVSAAAQASPPNLLAGTFINTALGNELTPIQKMGIKTIAEVYDFVYSLTQGGKGIQQKEAEASFADVKSSVNMNIALIKEGLADPDEVAQMIEDADRINNRLEQSAKGWSQKNLRYFLTDGIDVQTQVYLNKNLIRAWRLRLVQEQINKQSASQQIPGFTG